MGKLAFTCAIVLVCSSAWAQTSPIEIQQYAHRSWTQAEGLFDGSPRSLVQTLDGYLWLGTEFGLLRFDGVRFVPWRPPAGTRLPSSSVTKLLASSDGGLWIGTTAGLAHWVAGTLTTVSELTGQRISTVTEGQKGVVWAGTSANLIGNAVVCAIQGMRTTCHGADGTFGQVIFAVLEDRRGDLWVGSATGLWCWDPKRPVRYPLRDPAPEIHSMIEMPDGSLLIAINREVLQFVHGEVHEFPIQDTGAPFKPTALLRDRDSGLWIGTQDQGLLHVVNGKTDRFTRADGLSGDLVLGLRQDREGSVWAATINGLDAFRRYAMTTIGIRQGLASAAVGSVLAGRDGSVWIGTTDGLDRWSSDDMLSREMPTGLPKEVAATLFEDMGRRLWVSTPQGLAHTDGNQFAFVPGVPPGFIHAISEDAAGDLWVSDQYRGLFRLHQQRVAELIPWATFGGRSARSMVADPVDGGVWLGFFQGGVVYFKDGHIRETYSGTDSFGEGEVHDLYLDDDRTLWAATPNGIVRVKNGTVTTLTSKNGLPCDAVHWLVHQQGNPYWLYTACGLVRIDQQAMTTWAAAPQAKVTVRVFDTADGVPTNGSLGGYGPKVARTQDGRIWFSTYDGVKVFDPTDLWVNDQPPPVHIEGLTVDGRTYDAPSDLHFPSSARDVRIDYAGLSLTAPEKVRFRYMLEGRDRNWIDAGNRRQAFYTDLPPGEYRFHVIAANNSGVWNNQGDTWRLSIVPAFYQRTSFRIAGAFLLLALLWLWHLARLRRFATRTNLRFEDRLAERTRIAQDLHDTLLQGFLGVSMQLPAMLDELDDHPVKTKLHRVITRMRDVVEEGRLAVEGLRARSGTADELEHALRHDAAEFKGQQTVDVQFAIKGWPRPLNPDVADDVYHIGREALANAFRHANASRVEVTIEYAPTHLCLQIVDDGRGAPHDVMESGIPQHWGIRGMRERADRILGMLEISSHVPAGTCVGLVIPAKAVFRQDPKGPITDWFR